ncbi:MAG: hypothetical protein ACP5GJ_00615 [Nanopusillaceae archaeon]|jgi:uncharacterized membrane protein
MKSTEIGVYFLIIIIIALVALIFLIFFLYHGSLPILNSQNGLENTSINQLNNTYNNISQLIPSSGSSSS